jgi:hypothetical protein
MKSQELEAKNALANQKLKQMVCGYLLVLNLVLNRRELVHAYVEMSIINL